MVLDALLGRRSGRQPQMSGRASNSFVGVADGDAAFDTSAEVAAIIEANTTNASFTKIWEKTVEAGQLISWGHGNPNQQRNQGYLWFAAIDTGVDFEDGILRLMVSNSRFTRSEFIAEFDTRELHTTTVTTIVTAQPGSIDEKRPLPFTDFWVKEDSKLQLWFKTTAPGTTVDAVGFSIPVTIFQ